MNQLHNAFAVTTLLLFASASAFADAPVPPALSSGVLECPQADGTVLFTNKEKAGCRTMALKPLSVVPSLDHMPNSPPPPVTEAPASTMTPDRRDRTAPGWAKDWHAGLAQDGSTQDDLCALYGEWLNLVQKSRGGFFYGSDPSYGGDITGRNQRGPSQSFYDNARYVALSRMFGTGFIPAGCR